MDKAFEEIRHDGEFFAIILRENFTVDETTFFSSPEFSQQFGCVVYKKDGVIKAHFHNEVQREIKLTQEVLFIKRGRLVVNFYSAKKDFVTSRELYAGDTIFLCSGGHGFKMLEDTEMVEVKQGPYSGRDNDKEVFEGVENDPGK